jgi:hypothetical protein
MNRTARLDFDPLSRPAYVPMVSSVVAKPVETRHAQHVGEPKRRGRPKKETVVRVDPQHMLREPE